MHAGRAINSNLNEVAKVLQYIKIIKHIYTIVYFIFVYSFIFHYIFMCVQNGMEENGSILVEKVQIGSRPPKCEKRCTSCMHCEAVQVPILPSKVQIKRSHYSETKVTYSSRGDGLSNYKPISWKCKCGDYFFNP
jgi:hypothetical protein